MVPYFGLMGTRRLASFMLQCENKKMKWLVSLSQIFSGAELSSRKDVQGFLESRSAYLAQKSISEYTQARANMMFSTLLGEKTFQEAYERARWFSFPAALAMVAEALAGRIRNLDVAQTGTINAMLVAAARDIVGTYPVPIGGDAKFWPQTLVDLETGLERASLALPHAIHIIPKARAREIFDFLPVHPSVRRHDFDMFQNTLSFHLTEIAVEIEERLSAESADRIMNSLA